MKISYIGENYELHKSSTLESNGDYQLHCHDKYEIYYFISGDASYMVEGKIYSPKPHSIILLKPGIIHGVKTNCDKIYDRFAFHFSKNFILAEHQKTLLAPFHQDGIYFENVHLSDVFDRVIGAGNIQEEHLRDFAFKCRIESLLTELFSLSKLPFSDPTDNTAYKITRYINDNLSENLSLDSIAHEFFISKSQLGRIFSKNLGMSVLNYINLKRCGLAKQLIQEGKSASLAAEICGFKDYSTFYRSYKKYMGVMPKLS